VERRRYGLGEEESGYDGECSLHPYQGGSRPITQPPSWSLGPIRSKDLEAEMILVGDDTILRGMDIMLTLGQ